MNAFWQSGWRGRLLRASMPRLRQKQRTLVKSGANGYKRSTPGLMYSMSALSNSGI